MVTRPHPGRRRLSRAIDGDIAHVSTNLGEKRWFKTKDGYTPWTCREYRFLERQSNILPIVPPDPSAEPYYMTEIG